MEFPTLVFWFWCTQSIQSDRLWPFAICLKWMETNGRVKERTKKKTETLSSYRGEKFFCSSSSLLLFGQNQEIFFLLKKNQNITRIYLYCKIHWFYQWSLWMWTHNHHHHDDEILSQILSQIFFLLLLLLLMLWK